MQLLDVYQNESVIRHLKDSHKSCDLILRKKNELKELILILNVPYHGTIYFQSQKLTLSDVYGKWKAMHLHLEHFVGKRQFKSNLAKHLLTALEVRSKNIFNNPMMLAALYLDPRFRNKLLESEDKTDQAKRMLSKIYRRMHCLQAENEPEAGASRGNTSNDSLNDEFDEAAALTAFVNNTGASQPNIQRATATIDIDHIIDLFQPEPLQVTESILKYWESMKENERVMYELAMAVYSIPPTEVQIERDFSSLKWIFSDRRGCLTQSRLEEILMIHLNKDLFYKVNEENLLEAAEKGWSLIQN